MRQSTKRAEGRGREGMGGCGSGVAEGRLGCEGGKRETEGLAGALHASMTRARAAPAAAPRRPRARVRRRLPTCEKLLWRLCTASPLPDVPPPPPHLVLITFMLQVTQSPGVPWAPRLASARPPVAGPPRRRAASLQPSRPPPGRRNVRVSQPHAAPIHAHVPPPHDAVWFPSPCPPSATPSKPYL